MKSLMSDDIKLKMSGAWKTNMLSNVKGVNMKDDYLEILKDKEFLKSEKFKKLKKEFNDFIKNEWLK